MWRGAATVLTVLATAGCSALTNTGDSGSPPPPAPTTVTELRDRIQSATQTVSTAAISFSVTAGREKITATGGETLHDGQITGVTLDETVPGGIKMTVRTVDGKTYLKLPAPYTSTSRPWLLLDPNGASALDRIFTDFAHQVQTATSASDITTLSAAGPLHLVGDTKIDGALATQYSYDVDLERLPSSFPGRDNLLDGGVTGIPVHVWLDAKDRPVQFSELLSDGTHTVTVMIGISAYDLHLAITAPPSDQIGPA